MTKEDYLTKKDVLDYIDRQPDDARFCPNCVSVLVHAVDDPEGEYWYCNNPECKER